MKPSISIKQLQTIAELEEVQRLESSVWKMEPIPLHQTLSTVKNGGVILGAYDGRQLIGFNFAYPGYKDKKLYLWSHMMGLLDNYRGLGIGAKLKMQQRKIALEQGYDLISWTYDPLQSVNAYLNLSKLGSIGAYHIPSYYGEMKDGLNEGIPSDRFIVEWWINSPYLIKQRLAVYENTINREQSLLVPAINEYEQPYVFAVHELLKNWPFDPQKIDTNANNKAMAKVDQKYADHMTNELLDKPLDKQEVIHQLTFKDDWWVPIPTSIQVLKVENVSLAQDWRLKTRAVFNLLFEAGFVAVCIQRHEEDGVFYYQFKQKDRLPI